MSRRNERGPRQRRLPATDSPRCDQRRRSMSSAISRRPASRCSSTTRAKASSRLRSAAPPCRLPCSAPSSSAAPCRKVRLPRRQVRRHPLADARPRVASRPPPRAAGFIPRSTSMDAACIATLLPSSRRRSSPRSPSCSTRSRSTQPCQLLRIPRERPPPPGHEVGPR